MIQHRKQSGVVLIVVLWIVFLLTILLVGFTNVAKVERDASLDIVQRATGRASVEAVLSYLAALKDLGPETWNPILGQVLIIPNLQSVGVRFRVIPEDSYVSLNGADKETLQLLFSTLAPALDRPDLLAETIVARRAGDESAGVAALPWSSVNELLLLDFVRPDAVQPVLCWLTADSEHEGVNERYAQPALIKALYPDRSESILATRGAQSDSASAQTSIPKSLSLRGPRAGDARFRVQVEVDSGRLMRHLEATITFDGAAGYRVVRWNEYNAFFDLDEQT